jgi:hypothetical protein
MANPQRYTSGLSTFPIQHVLNTFPVVPTQFQVTKGDDFIPFRQSTDYTATTGGTGATAAAFSWNGGAIKLTAGSTTPFKSFEALGANSLQIIPGNQVLLDVRMAIPTGSMQNPATDSVIYAGLFDNVDPTAASNGIYFTKPAAGSALNLVVLKGGTATTFQNVGDLAKPSGIFNDVASTAGSLTFNATGTTFTTVTVSNSGAGYRCAPLVLPFGTAGSGAGVYCQLGGNTQGISYRNGAVDTNNSGLYAPYIYAAGSGYTAGTLGADILPWINVQFWYDGKGTLHVGINGRKVLTLGYAGVTTATPGSTYNVATAGNSFNFQGTTLTSGVAPVQPFNGDFFVAAPLVPLQLAFGLVGTNGNSRVMYVEEINLATELN